MPSRTISRIAAVMVDTYRLFERRTIVEASSVESDGVAQRGGASATLLALVLLANAVAFRAHGDAADDVAAPPSSIATSIDASTSAPSEAEEIEAVLTLEPGGRDLRLDGDLTEGVATRVSTLLAAHPEIERVELASDGGLVEEATALAALVTARSLATYVRDDCASACTLVFVRGRRRYLAEGGRLGFHAPYEEDAARRTWAVDPTPERQAYLDAGIAPAFAARALATPADEIWIPTPAELIEAGVATDLVAERHPRHSRGGRERDLADAEPHD